MSGDVFLSVFVEQPRFTLIVRYEYVGLQSSKLTIFEREKPQGARQQQEAGQGADTP